MSSTSHEELMDMAVEVVSPSKKSLGCPWGLGLAAAAATRGTRGGVRHFFHPMGGAGPGGLPCADASEHGLLALVQHLVLPVLLHPKRLRTPHGEE